MFCLQVKWQLERLLGRYWVKLSTCHSAPLMSEWPRALERLYTFSAQRQEMTQLSTTFPTNINIYTPHAHSFDSICFEKIQFSCHLGNIFNSFWQFIISFPHKTHKVISTETSHLGPLTSAEFCPWNEDVLVTISEDRTFKVGCVCRSVLTVSWFTHRMH